MNVHMCSKYKEANIYLNKLIFFFDKIEHGHKYYIM